jgi:hypothetical protein
MSTSPIVVPLTTSPGANSPPFPIIVNILPILDVLRTLTGVIVDEGHNYSSVPVLLLHIGKIVWIRKDRNGAYTPRVFIFWLKQNDWTTICNLRFSNRRADVSNVVICRSEIVRCSGSKLTLDALKPAGEAAATRLSIDVLKSINKRSFSV